jgi:hypothetical protein
MELMARDDSVALLQRMLLKKTAVSFNSANPYLKIVRHAP